MKIDKEFGKWIRTIGKPPYLYIKFFERGIIITRRNAGRVRLNYIDSLILFDELKRFKENNEMLNELQEGIPNKLIKFRDELGE